MRAEELPSQADVDGAAPIFRADVLDAAGRTGDPGIVDQRVETPKRGFDVVEQANHVRLGGDVSLGDSGVGVSGAVVSQELAGDVAYMDLRAAGYQQVGDRSPNARRAGGDEDAQPLGESQDVRGTAHESLRQLASPVA